MAARYGVRPEELAVRRTPASSYVVPVEYLSAALRAGVVLDERQNRAAVLRHGTFEERLVAAALGWSREVRVPVKSPGRRPRALDVADVTARVDVELDSLAHASENARDFDRRYDAVLIAEGWQILRFWNSEALNELDRVCRIAEAAAGRGWHPPQTGSVEDALGYAATPELAALMRPIAERICEVSLPQILPGGIIAFWLVLHDRRAPLAYLFAPDATLVLTSLADRASVHRLPTSGLQRRFDDLGLYLSYEDRQLQIRPDFAERVTQVAEAIQDAVLRPLTSFAALSDEEQVVTLMDTVFAYFEKHGLIRASLNGGQAVVEAAAVNEIWPMYISKLMIDVRRRLLHSNLTAVQRVSLRLHSPDRTEVLVDAWCDRESSYRAVHERLNDELTVWDGHIDARVEHRRDVAMFGHG